MKKRIVSILLALVLCVGLLPAAALGAKTVAIGTCGAQGNNVAWELDDTGTLTIYGEGAMKNCYGTSPWYSQRASIKTVVIENGVTSIGEYAFYICSSLSSITIPDSVTSIGQAAFSRCSSLTSVAIPDSVTSIAYGVFESCSSLTSVAIPDSVTSIGKWAFYGCSSLTMITIPDSVTSIEYQAFAGCSSLTSITIPDGVTTIEKYMFQGCSNLTSITIPNSVTSIGEGVFFECSSLAEITIPNSVSSVGESAFEKCVSLIDVYFNGTQEQWNAIYIRSYNAPLLNATIHYVIPVDSISLNPSSLELYINDNATLTATVLPENATDKTVTWSSSDEAVVTVDDAGNVTAIAPGTATVTATAGSFSATCEVTVRSLYSVRFHGSGGSGEMADQTFACGEAQALTANAFTRTGYTFLGWAAVEGGPVAYADGESVLDLSDVHGDMVELYAVWALDSPVITRQPVSTAANEDAAVTFTVVATGTDLAYQWQYKTPTGTWKNSPAEGSRTATLSVPATASRNGYSYRCIVKNDAGSVTSSAAALTVKLRPVITDHPQDATATEGGAVTFRVTATGSDLTYQWQYRVPGGSWKNSPAEGNRTAALTVPVTLSRNGNSYRCVVTNSAGSDTSDPATLTVCKLVSPSITGQPRSVTAEAGGTAVFRITAVGTDLAYQWQYRIPGGSWKNSPAEGNRTAALTIPVTLSRNGYGYRCVVTNSAGSDTSDPVTLTVETAAKPLITAQPQDQTITAGDRVTFTVDANGATGYQWQVSLNGGRNWSNCKVAGYDTDTYSFITAVNHSGRLYRCIITNAAGSVTSSAAKLTVTEASLPVIITQPANVSKTSGSTVTFKVTATDAESYHWQMSRDGGATWTDCTATGFDTNSYSFKATRGLSGRQYRCIVTNAAGSVTSSAATLTVK